MLSYQTIYDGMYVGYVTIHKIYEYTYFYILVLNYNHSLFPKRNAFYLHSVQQLSPSIYHRVYVHILIYHTCSCTNSKILQSDMNGKFQKHPYFLKYIIVIPQYQYIKISMFTYAMYSHIQNICHRRRSSMITYSKYMLFVGSVLHHEIHMQEQLHMRVEWIFPREGGRGPFWGIHHCRCLCTSIMECSLCILQIKYTIYMYILRVAFVNQV